MADSLTYVEKMEEQQSLMGNAVTAGEIDKAMLEISETNRLIISDKQAQLMHSFEMIVQALIARDNVIPVYEERINENTGEKEKKQVIINNWRVLEMFNEGIQKKQLTRAGYSRQQYLGIAKATVAVQKEEEQKKGLFGGLFG